MKVKGPLLLLLAAMIWGVAFVAQSVGMDHVGPWTFLCVRSLIAGVSMLPVVAVLSRSGTAPKQAAEERRNSRKTLLTGGICCGTVLGVASILQQIGLQYTSVGKAGFLTACYILIVPLLGLLLGRRCGRLVWCGVAVALLGLYFLCFKDGSPLNFGDILVFISATLFSGHILLIDHFIPLCNGVKMSCIQFFVCGAVALVGMLVFEEPSLPQLLAAWKPLLYAGVLSSGVGYTIQIIGQRGMNPTVASLIMSLESVFAVLAGWLILHQHLSGREMLGCVLVFVSIVLAQLPEGKSKCAEHAQAE